MRIPHAFRCYGKTWRVRWADRPIRTAGAKPDFNPDLHESHVDEALRVVTLNSELRGRPRQAFKALVHEVMHIVNFEERHRPGRSHYRIRHETMYHLDGPFGGALLDMGVTFRCVCKPCRARH